MNSDWTFDSGGSVGGPWEHGCPSDWHWSRGDGEYWKHRDFFDVHWEVHPALNPEAVRLHVESPAQNIDRNLNYIKCVVVERLGMSRIRDAAEAKGFSYAPGSRTSTANMLRNKCTEAFRIVVPQHMRGSSTEADIALVHQEFGELVDAVLDEVRPQLHAEFSRQDGPA